MKIFGVSRPTAACAAAGLFVLAQTVAFAQNFGSRSQAVITKTDAYLPAAAQMIASANADEVVVHPQGRYALIKQSEASLPPGPLVGEATTGAAALLLYDARLRKTRTLWERRADGGKHQVLSVQWLPGTDCALAVTYDSSAPSSPEVLPDGISTLLFFDFTKSMTPRVLVTSTNYAVSVNVSPTKPLFIVQGDQQIRMGNAPRGILGPVLSLRPRSAFGYEWDAAGTAAYGTEFVKAQATPDAKLTRRWFVWDGKAASATELDATPTKAMIARSIPPPALPIALRTGMLSIPASLAQPHSLLASQQQTPQTKTPATKAAGTPQTTLLHPLYLEATTDPAAATDNPNRSALLAPDADESYLLADQSAVLYQSGGALYVVPLVRLKSEVYAQVQKAQAIQNAKQVGLGILMYSQDYDEDFPPQTGFPDAVGPYVKNAPVFQNFTYLRPAGPLASVAMPATTIIGFVTAPGGRAVVYVDGHVKWENSP